MPSKDIVQAVRGACAEWATGNWRAGADLLSPAVVLTAQIPEGCWTFDRDLALKAAGLSEGQLARARPA